MGSNWLTQWRSYIPLAFILLFGAAFSGFDRPLHSCLLHEVWSYICFGISVLGLLIRAITVGQSPTGASVADETAPVASELSTSGLYSTVRHPLYLGNYLIGLGVSLIILVWWLPIIYSVLYWMYYERAISVEEDSLRGRFNELYERWAALTPAFWPSFSRWRKADLPFSLRKVLRYEYPALLVVSLGHAGTELLEHLVIDHRVVWETFWAMLLCGGIATYFVLWLLDQHTSVLDESRR